MIARMRPFPESIRRRFGLRALLLVVTCCAVLLGAVRISYHRGYRSGEQAKRRETVVTIAYEVDDLLQATPGGAAPATLIDFISETVEPQSWEAAGGVGKIDYFRMSSTLVITQSEAAHDKIAALLETLRANMASRQSGVAR